MDNVSSIFDIQTHVFSLFYGKAHVDRAVGQFRKLLRRLAKLEHIDPHDQ